jgi:polyisoprenoid-binding protein YceI
MRLTSKLLFSLFAWGTLGLAAAPTGPVSRGASSPTTAASYTVDPTHSHVLWKVKHNNASYFYGRFAKFSGSFTFDEKKPGDCEVLMEVDAASVDTRTSMLDKHLRSPDFFDAVQFTTLIFESTDVAKGKGKNMYSVTGRFTVHGVTRSITFDLEHTGNGKSRDGPVIGFHTSFTIDRTKFGMNYGLGGIGKEVEIIISIEAGRG